MKKKTIIPAAAAVLLILSCSSVFTSSISGSLHDQELYDTGQVSGIGEAEIYLYLEEPDRDTDYFSWESDGVEPGSSSSPRYFLSTTTDAEGGYSFNGIIWEELFPEFGKTASRVEVFMLIYHRDYGLVKNPQPLYIVSDVTNRIPLIKIQAAINRISVRGSVFDRNVKDAYGGALPLAGVGVNVYVPVSWGYDSAGNVTDPEFPKEPSYTFLTGEEGIFSGEVAYPMKPSRSENRMTTQVLVTYNLENHVPYELTAGANAAFEGGDSSIPLEPSNWSFFQSGMNADYDIDEDGVGNPAILKTLTADPDRAATANHLPGVEMRRFSFTSSLEGHTYEDAPGATLKSGMEVRFFWDSGNYADADYDYSATSRTVYRENATTEEGSFSITGIQWRQYNYTESQPVRTCSITTEDYERDGYSLTNGENHCEIDRNTP